MDVGGKIVDLGGKHYRLARSIESAKRRINQDKRWAKWAHAKGDSPGQGHDHGHDHELMTSFAIANHSCEILFACLLCERESLFRDEEAKVCKSCVSGLLLRVTSPGYFSPTAVRKEWEYSWIGTRFLPSYVSCVRAALTTRGWRH